ncbi:MAG: DUF2063 domain-containing protein [Moraxellaceae bacterium]|nr:MAG: DUF2063 domain-containing protein [Moraxellaceae bacterium]
MTSLSLTDLQTALQQYLLNQKNNIDAFTTETQNFSRDERLGIYHTAYRLRLIDTLRHDFPALELSIGDDIFSNVMSEFIAYHPSQHPSLRWFGAALPKFLKAHPIAQHQIEIYELAEFEWAQAMAFDAQDAMCSCLDDARSLQPTQWLSLRLEFHPSLQQLSLISNAPDIWHSLINDNIKIETHMNTESVHWLIWRHELQVLYRSIDETEHWCLDTFLNNKNFSDICEGLCTWLSADQVPQKAAQYLQSWLQNGLVSKIITDEVE